MADLRVLWVGSRRLTESTVAEALYVHELMGTVGSTNVSIRDIATNSEIKGPT